MAKSKTAAGGGRFVLLGGSYTDAAGTHYSWTRGVETTVESGEDLAALHPTQFRRVGDARAEPPAEPPPPPEPVLYPQDPARAGDATYDMPQPGAPPVQASPTHPPLLEEPDAPRGTAATDDDQPAGGRRKRKPAAEKSAKPKREPKSGRTKKRG